MVEYADEDFGRLLSESPSQELTMSDAIPHRTSLPSLHQNVVESIEQGFEDMAMDVDSGPHPWQSREPDYARYPKFIIAIDFGTTFSTVAVLRLDSSHSADIVGPESIQCVDHYPDMPDSASAAAFSSNPAVPTELMCGMQDSSDTADISDQASIGSLEEEWDLQEPEGSDEERRRPPINPQTPAIHTSIWGWGVHCLLSTPQDIPVQAKHLKNYKLLLDESPRSADLRRDCLRTLRALKGVKTVDVLAEYLKHLLKHAKARLTETHGLRDDSSVEFVLCLPNKWTDKAARVMQTALTTAIEESRIARLANGAIEDLFIVAESEAAAAYALQGGGQASKLTTDEAFLLLDCGGGTVDAVIYSLTQREPVRLREEVSPSGESCGSSFLNHAFKELLESRLAEATIIGNDSTLHQIITTHVQNFEHRKKSINLLERNVGFRSLHVPGLQRDPPNGFQKNLLELRREDMTKVFKSCLRGVADLMLQQLNDAKAKEINVQTVILIGGFGASPTLKNHLTSKLRQERNLLGEEIQLLPSTYIESAVARGAILRALRKEDGPERITRSSYGVLRDILYNPEDSNHRRFHVTRDRADGELYVKNTIFWVLDKGKTVPPKHETCVRSRHIFRPGAGQFLCEEVLYVSSEKHPSGFKRNHPKNKGAEEAGRIVADMTFLRSEKLITPISATNSEGKRYEFYQVEFDLWIIIIGRTLRFEARSPLKPEEVRASVNFCIAAGFVPGTD